MPTMPQPLLVQRKGEKVKQILKSDLIPQGFCGIEYYDLCEALIECKDCQHWVNRPSLVSVNLLREVLKDLQDKFIHTCQWYPDYGENMVISQKDFEAKFKEAFKGVLEK